MFHHGLWTSMNRSSKLQEPFSTIACLLNHHFGSIKGGHVIVLIITPCKALSNNCLSLATPVPNQCHVAQDYLQL